MHKIIKLVKSITTVFILIIGIMCIYANNFVTYSNTVKPKFNVLVLNSYSIQNGWERNIYIGISNEVKSYEDDIDIDLHYEFLDTNIRKDEEYLKTYENLLNKKYEFEDVSAIIAVDDEAFDMMRKLVLNENSIFYQKKLLFVGVSQQVSLTKQEKQYITGLNEIEDNLEALNTILTISDNIKTVNYILDNSIYSEVTKSRIENIKKFTKYPVNINYIQEKYIEDVVDKLKKIDGPNQVNIISGVWLHKDLNEHVNTNETIKIIENTSKSPIYTSIESYIDKGVVGGFVDQGREQGKMIATILMEVIKGDITLSEVPLISEPSGKFILNYKKIYEYDINPLKIPPNSVITNRGKFDLFIPKELKFIINILLITILLSVVIAFYMLIKEYKKNKENKKLYEKSKERENLKSSFIINMSHELRTPLNVILSTTSLIEMKSKNNDFIETNYLLQRMDSIKNNSNRLLRLVNNLIDITKFESGVYDVHFENLNIVEVVEDTIDSVVDFAKKKEINLVFDTDNEEIMMAIDREKIERIILNLISNAIKFTRQNGKIIINIKTKEENVYIDIKDNGIGIPKDKINEIFERFYQVENILVRSNEGSGIGLCIVKELVNLHNGEIYVESESNKGTKFTIRLPINKLDSNSDIKKLNSMDLKDLAKLELSDIDK